MKAELNIYMLTKEVITETSDGPVCEEPRYSVSEGGDIPDTCGTGNVY